MKNSFRANKKDNSKRKGDVQKQRARRRDEAIERQKVYSVLTTDQKLLWIDSRLGNSAKERGRLLTQQGV